MSSLFIPLKDTLSEYSGRSLSDGLLKILSLIFTRINFGMNTLFRHFKKLDLYIGTLKSLFLATPETLYLTRVPGTKSVSTFKNPNKT
jgi:hypothetical protein